MVWVSLFTSFTSLAISRACPTPRWAKAYTGHTSGASCPSSGQGLCVDSEVGQAWVKNSFPLPTDLLCLWADIRFTCIGASINTHKQSAYGEEAWTGLGQDTQIILPIEPPSATSSTSHRKEKTPHPRLSCERWKGGQTGTQERTVLVTFNSVISPSGKLS